MAKQSALKVPTGLSPEKQAKVDAILKKYEEQNRQIEREHAKEMAKLYGGAALQIGSAFIPGTLGLKLAGGAIKGLTPIVGRKIAQNVATGVTSGLAGGAVEGLGRGLMENQNPLKTMATDSLAGGLLGGLGGYGLGKVAQKLNTQNSWHGSGAIFDKFDDAYIGTGEGAQAHGMGHYTAKNRDTAQGYADKLGTYRLENPEKVPFDYQTQRDLITAHQIGKEELIRKLQNMIEIEDYDDEIVNLKNRIENVDKNYDKVNLGIHKKLYKLTIPKDDVMLREDLPFSQQPKAVQESLLSAYNDIRNKELEDIIGAKDLILETLENAKKNGSDRLIYSAEKNAEEMLPIYNKKIQELEKDYLPQDWKGNIIYGDFVNKIANKNNVWGLNKDTKQGLLDAKKEASKLLNQHGIKGISYNGGIDGEANVIFNPDDIDIIPYYDNPTSFKEKFINLLNR